MLKGMFNTVAMSVNVEDNKLVVESEVDYSDDSKLKGYLEKVLIKPTCEIPSKIYADEFVSMFSIDGAELAKIQELRDLLTMYKDIVGITMEQINSIYDFVAQIDGPIVFSANTIDDIGFQLAIKCKEPKATIDNALTANGLGLLLTPRENGYEVGDDFVIIYDKDYIYVSNKPDDKTSDGKMIAEIPFIKDNFGKSISLSYSELNLDSDTKEMSIYGSASDVEKSTMVIELKDSIIYMLLKNLAKENNG